MNHSQTHNIVWTQRSGSAVSAGTLDTDYSDSPFVILCLGKVSQDKMSHVLNPLQGATYSLTNKKLASTLKKFSHPTEPACILLAICMRLFILRNLISNFFFRSAVEEYSNPGPIHWHIAYLCATSYYGWVSVCRH